MRSTLLIGLFTLCVAMSAFGGTAHAQASDTQGKQLFIEGIELFEQGAYGDALARFEASYAVAPLPVVLYNLGLTHAELKDPVSAVEALGRLVQAPGKLKPQRLLKAKQVLAEQKARLAQLQLLVEPGATIHIDGKPVSATPSLTVRAGELLLEATMEGKKPYRRALRLEPGQTVQLTVEFEPLASKLAQVRVVSQLPGADILVDGILVGRTPLVSSFGVEPGSHRVELRRAGYLPRAEVLVLAEGGSAEIALELEQDRAQRATSAMRVELTLDPSDAAVFVNGELQTNPGELRLPQGPHRLRLERSGYLTMTVPLDLPPNAAVVRRTIALTPLPEELQRRRDERTSSQVAGFAALGTGSLFAVAGAIILGANTLNRQEASDLSTDQTNSTGSFAGCDAPSTEQAKVCDDERLALLALKNVTLGLDIGGAIGLVLGVGSAIAGGVIAAGAEDVSRYESRPVDDWAILPAVELNQQGFRIGAYGRF
jgi:hypothetical protein